jgi:cytochrome c553
MSKPSWLGWLTALILPFIYVSAYALTLSTSTLALIPGETATVSLSRISGTVSLANTNTTVATATLSSNTVKVTGKAVGSATLSIKDRNGTKTVAVTVKAAMSVSPTSLSVPVGQSATLTASNASGSISLTNSDASKLTASLSGNVITVKGIAVGGANLTVRDSKTSVVVPITVTSAPLVGGSTNGRLLASNCFQCHGTNGSGGFDNIAGENESEILAYLRKFASGAEGDGIMAAHAVGYTDAQMQAISKYLATQ